MRDTSMYQGNVISKLSRAVVSLIGLPVLAYAVYTAALAPVNAEWVLLSLVTILLVSRIDLSVTKASSPAALSNAFIYLSVLLYGINLSVIVAGIDTAVCALQNRAARAQVWFKVAAASLSIYISGTVVAITFGGLNAYEVDLISLGVAACAMALMHYLLNSAATSIDGAMKEPAISVSSRKESFIWASVSHLAAAAAACLMAKLIEVISFYAFVVAVPILVISYFTYKVYQDKIEATNHHAEQMADLHLKTIEALAIAIDAKDEVTHDHVRRVQVYSTGLARLFGLSEPEIEALRAGALLHDIGKLAVPDYILNKPGNLTPAEFEKMKVHTIVGAEILERVGFPYPVVPVVRHHHERWDGRGYPDGLRGDEIPIVARILMVADCFDAVRETRQYRKAMSRDEAIRLLQEGSGTVFDPNVVSIFLDHLEDFEAEIREQGVSLQSSHVSQRGRVEKPAPIDAEPVVFERIRSAHREVIALYDIAQTIGTSLDLRDTFAVFSSRLADMVSYTTCVLYLLRPDSTDVEAMHVSGHNADRFKGRRMPSGAGITGWVVANRHPMHNCDPSLDFDALKVHITQRYRTATVVPLVRDSEVLGALALYSADLPSYDADHLRLAEAVAKLASDAIANAVHHEQAETSALTDILTGLPNARALRYRFDEEMDRAIRHRDTFSVVMMDVDGFKAINDHLGHLAGDQLLREIAKLLLSLIRSYDFVSRYAGDEFVAIMQIGPEEAHDLISRIQKAVEKHNFGAGGNTQIGISIGWACFGTDGDTLDELLLAADRAMYADKSKRKAMLSSASNPKTNNLDQYRVM
jgi:diguanylate cyclase (GGDEF)-like protein/putative nucleotidyltransferase with HDIG domain